MKLLIDSADIKAIRRLYEYYPVDGVTTNPSILLKEGGRPYETLRTIRSFIGKKSELHVQVTAEDAEGMIEDAHRIVKELTDATLVKIPAVPEGFKAMKTLSKDGIRVTATAIYTPLQGYMASIAGAYYAAPYINRIDNLGYNGIEVAEEIHDIYENNSYSTGVLAASFRNSRQVLELCRYGIAAATVSPDILDGFFLNPAVDEAVRAFNRDFQTLRGDDTTMSST